ncbi:histidine phosphatase superfamily [Phlyctochytrium arcticum]|nr:histidine phosphatase superfamily [Phlyctochytrium arcticum]
MPDSPAFPPLTQAVSTSCIVKRLFLCRHGETALNAEGLMQGRGVDLFLNDTGERQAEYLQQRLSTEKIDLFVSSNLKRARQTAEISHRSHNSVPFIQVEDLAEISWGDWEGVQFPGLRKLLKSWEGADFDAKPPNGESPLEVEKRSVPALFELLKRKEDHIAIVVHGRLLRIMLSSMLYKSLAHMSTFTHHNTCINVIDVLIETDPSQGPPEVATSHSEAGGDGLATDGIHKMGQSRSLDDNVEVTAEETRDESPMTETLSRDQPSAITSIDHPSNMKFVAVVLDSRDHLPKELGGGL